MKMKCVKPYYDLLLKENKAVGDEFEADSDRAKTLVSKEVAVVIKETNTTTKKVAKPKKKEV